MASFSLVTPSESAFLGARFLVATARLHDIVRPITSDTVCTYRTTSFTASGLGPARSAGMLCIGLCIHDFIVIPSQLTSL